MERELVIIESPWRAKTPAEQFRNKKYAILCMQDSISRGEAPYASHLLYTQFLIEENNEQRNLGIEIGLAWGEKAVKTVVYQDFGLTSGMNYGIRHALKCNRPVEYREISDKISHNVDSLGALSLLISEYFSVNYMKMISSDRSEELVIARYCYFKAAKQLFPKISLKEIGKLVNRPHSTVIAGMKKLDQKYHMNAAYKRFCAEKFINLEHHD